MSDTQHTMRFQLIRNKQIIGTVEPMNDGKADNVNMTTTSSIEDFPLSSFTSTNPELNKLFLSFSKNDLMLLSVRTDENSDFQTMFRGDFFKMNTKFEKEPDILTLEVEAIHSFYKLSLLQFQSEITFSNLPFQDFVTKLLENTAIDSKVLIDKELSRFPVTGISRKTNAFRLFKEVCLLAGATASFSSDNSVNIDFRENKIHRIRKSTPVTITADDILSSKHSNQI